MITPDRTVLSPNYNDAPVAGKTVIIHATRSGKPGYALEMQGTLIHMLNPGTVSSQWVIGRDGEKVRVVPDNKQSWHAQEDNDNAWGIELCQGVESDGFTAPQLEALILVCRGYVTDFGVPIARAGNSTVGGFIGHQATDQGIRNGKSDPGALFPWGDFIKALTATPPVGVPDPDVQADAVLTVLKQINNYKLGKPIDPASADVKAVFARVNDLVQRQ